MAVQTIQLSHLEGYPVHVGLFEDVQNAAFLRQQLLDGNAEFEYAFLDATTILSTTHVLAAVFRAINDMLANRLRSNNVHSEIVFSLSPNNNIAESFRRFGVQSETTNLLAIKVSTEQHSSDAVSSHLASNVEGRLVPFTDETLAAMVDMPRVRKIYKLDSLGASGKAAKEGKSNGVNGASAVAAAAEWEQAVRVVVGLMALKGS